MTIKTFYKVNNLEFDNLKDAETFDSYLKSFDNKQMHEIYMGLLNDVNVLLYATSKLDWNEMRTIRWKLEGKNKKA